MRSLDFWRQPLRCRLILTSVLVVFALFRLFDILKPPPIRHLDEHVSGGFGVVIDDVIAGLMACPLAHLILYFVVAMRIETLIIGDELLDGRVTDTNSVRFAQALGEYGLELSRRTTITDDTAIIVEEAGRIAGRGTELCLVVVAWDRRSMISHRQRSLNSAGSSWRDEAEATKIRERLERFGRPVTENSQQADRPAGAEVIANPVGTAPGFAISHGRLPLLFRCQACPPSSMRWSRRLLLLPCARGSERPKKSDFVHLA